MSDDDFYAVEQDILELVGADPVLWKGTLSRGSVGDQVKALQEALAVSGAFSETVDGRFGETTERAVLALQKIFGVKADGHAGSQFEYLLRLANAAKRTPQRAVQPAVVPPQPTVEPSSGTETKISFWQQPMWTGAPLRWWHGAVGLGALGALGLGVSLWLRGRRSPYGGY